MRVKQWEEIDSPGCPLDFQRLPGIPIVDAAMMPGRRLRLKFLFALREPRDNSNFTPSSIV